MGHCPLTLVVRVVRIEKDRASKGPGSNIFPLCGYTEVRYQHFGSPAMFGHDVRAQHESVVDRDNGFAIETMASVI